MTGDFRGFDNLTDFALDTIKRLNPLPRAVITRTPNEITRDRRWPAGVMLWTDWALVEEGCIVIVARDWTEASIPYKTRL